MPVAGHVELHVGVAVKICELPSPTVDAAGPTATDDKVTDGGAVTVMVVELPVVVPLRVAFTKMPTVPAVLPAVKVIEGPLPLSEPSAELERSQL
jgi:hypothetical protein